MDPAPALPPAKSTAPAETGLLVLEVPRSSQADETLVTRFFEAVTARDAKQLEQLLEAGAKTKANARASPMDALDFWKSRLSRLDYSRLNGQSIYQRHSVEIYREQDLRELGSERSLPVSVGAHQVAIRVPLHAPQSDKTRLFGDEIVFLLTPTQQGLRITEIVEDFQLP